MAWTTWNHPNMPWDGCGLWVGDLAGDSITGPRLVAGGEHESIFQPEWSPGGVLHFVSDRTGWWNLYREAAPGAVEAVAPMEAEFGAAQWAFGMSTYAFLGDGRIACVYVKDGLEHLGMIAGESAMRAVSLPFTSYSESLVASGERLAFVGGGADRPSSVVVLHPATGEFEVVRRSLTVDVEPGYLSKPEALDFETPGGVRSHALFYPPSNVDFEGPAGERPPLLVVSHGGPTSNTTANLRLSVQFWTSRGFAVVDVDYRGSTGYGREYRNALRGQWGIADVEDCIAAARSLAEALRVDPGRLAIRGASAGGYTTLCALTFHEGFAVGASYFGVSDPAAMARDTHKFESRYLDRLIGPYPEARAVYEERSPVHHVDRLSTPLILFQGLEDEVVPPPQSEMIAAALERKGVPYAYLTFEGEQHGFRRAENIQRSLEAELSFYGQILGFTPADEIEPLEIRNPYRGVL
jgi:dipeptidyl aminopeptidase/acylaminoacyl peptidase